MRKIPQAVAMILLATALQAQEPQTIQKRIGTAVRAQSEVTQALKNFLAHVDDPKTHEQWWADELIYTGSSGAVKTKPEIVRSVQEAAGKATGAAPSASPFEAEDIKVSQYGDVAVLTFRLVQHDGDKINYFRNSGVLVKRDQRWQVVAWQATKAPDYRPESAPKPSGKE